MISFFNFLGVVLLLFAAVAKGEALGETEEFYISLSKATHECEQSSEPGILNGLTRTFYLYPHLKLVSNLLRKYPEDQSMRSHSVEEKISKCLHIEDYSIRSTLIYLGEDLKTPFGLIILLKELNRLAIHPNPSLTKQLENALTNYSEEEIKITAAQMGSVNTEGLKKTLENVAKVKRIKFLQKGNALQVIQAIFTYAELELQLLNKITPENEPILPLDLVFDLAAEEGALSDIVSPDLKEIIEYGNDNKPLLNQMLKLYLNSECRLSGFISAEKFDSQLLIENMKEQFMTDPKCIEFITKVQELAEGNSDVFSNIRATSE